MTVDVVRSVVILEKNSQPDKTGDRAEQDACTPVEGALPCRHRCDGGQNSRSTFVSYLERPIQIGEGRIKRTLVVSR